MLNQSSSTAAFSVESLASGSSGNVMLVRSRTTCLLLDAGRSLRVLGPQLARRGIAPEHLSAILLTHEHTDHISGAGAIARRSRIPIVANRPTLAAFAERDGLDFEAQELATGDETRIGDIKLRSFAVPHDAAAPVGYVLEANGARVTYFTDAGCVTPAMREALRGASLAIVEANHDVDWLMRGPYTPDMKARVASQTGHLCNADCGDLLAERLDEGGCLHIWLAHLSRVNNSPSLARRTVQQRIQRHTRVPFTLEIALRDQPSVMWQAGRQAVQLSLL